MYYSSEWIKADWHNLEQALNFLCAIAPLCYTDDKHFYTDRNIPFVGLRRCLMYIHSDHTCTFTLSYNVFCFKKTKTIKKKQQLGIRVNRRLPSWHTHKQPCWVQQNTAALWVGNNRFLTCEKGWLYSGISMHWRWLCSLCLCVALWPCQVPSRRSLHGSTLHRGASEAVSLFWRTLIGFISAIICGCFPLDHSKMTRWRLFFGVEFDLCLNYFQSLGGYIFRTCLTGSKFPVESYFQVTATVIASLC